ncbi:MAG: metallophosphoesterase [Motiliproteus sp.]
MQKLCFSSEKTWFTSDTHFGHSNILKHAKRPFANSDEMDHVMIQRWNTCVGPNDCVYHLGDFAWGGAAKAEHYLKQLNGQVFLVPGNHDKASVCQSAAWAGVLPPIHCLKVNHPSVIHLVLCHYPMREWPKQYHGAVHLYGHVHGNLESLPGSVEVSVDCWDYRPIELDELLTRRVFFNPTD